jgi:1-acyl-sn-glycerol-3-phosphate acyltransferase
MGLSSSVVALVDRSGRTSHLFAQYWSRFIFWGIGIRVQLKGEENIPKDTAVIFAANHQSTLDIPAMFGYLPVQFRIMAKQILFWVPFLGWHLFLAGNIPIDRKNPKKAFGSVWKASSVIKKGISILAFVEGTRSRDGKLHRFKRGSFTLAKKLNVPVVPVAIRGTFDLMSSDAWLARPGEIEILIRPIVNVTEEMKLDDLAAEVREQLLAAGLANSE